MLSHGPLLGCLSDGVNQTLQPSATRRPPAAESRLMRSSSCSARTGIIDTTKLQGRELERFTAGYLRHGCKTTFLPRELSTVRKGMIKIHFALHGHQRQHDPGLRREVIKSSALKGKISQPRRVHHDRPHGFRNRRIRLHDQYGTNP